MQEQISFEQFLKESLPQSHPEYDINEAIMEAREKFRTSPGIDDDFARIIDSLFAHGFYIIGSSARKVLKHQVTPLLKLYTPFPTDLSLRTIKEVIRGYIAELIESEDGYFITPDAMHLPLIKIELHEGNLFDILDSEARVDLDLIAIGRFGIECRRRSHLSATIQDTLDAIGRATAWEYIPMAELSEEEAIELAVDGFTCRPIPTL